MKKKSKKKSGGITTIILLVVLLAGLSLLMYPTVANYINAKYSSKAISNYFEEIDDFDEEAYQAILDEAIDFNNGITSRLNRFLLSEAESERYYKTLQLSDNSAMGFIEIPCIDVTLPIYHGTSAQVLNSSVGHIEWSSLPIGGEGTHCVLSGHRGLPSAKLFTDLDKVDLGDVFVLHILNEILTYEVDQILIVDPDDTLALQITPEEDYCTLLTCTPYGINTQRLLVRGHRIENAAEAVMFRVTADAIKVEPLIVASVLAVPMLLLMLILVYIIDGFRKKKKAEGQRREEL